MTFQRCSTRYIVCLMLAFGLVVGGAQSPVAQAATGQDQNQDAMRDAIARPQEIACAPRLAIGEASSPITLIGSAADPAKTLFGPGDALVISGGTEQGVGMGQEYFVRSVLTARGPDPANPNPLLALRTAGWLRVVAVQQTSAMATVVHTCGEFELGDHLEPFALPASPMLGPAGEADYTDPALVLFGRDGSVIVGQRQFMVIDRGSSQGVEPGQRLTIFRETVGPEGPVIEIAEAVIVSVAPDSATARLLKAQDPVYAGDLVAVHR